MSRNAEDCENSGSLPQLESEPEVEQIGETPEDVPFTIPLKWKWATIGDSLQYGSSEQVNGQSIPRNAWVLDLEDIEKESGRLLIKKRNISNRSNKAKFKKGDVLYGKLRPYLNKCIIANEAGFSTTEIVAIRPKEGNYKFDAEYLKAFLMSPFFVNYANRASYGVKMPRLGTKDAKAAYIPVPPLAEQHRIVARLNELLPLVDDFGEAQEAFTIAQTEFPGKLEASLLQAAIEGKLVPQLESEPEVEQIGEAPEEVPFEIPKKWKWMSFDCVVKTFPSKNYQIQTKEIALEGKYPVISQAKAKIDGYCDDESKLIPKDKIPFVIFGDHTRVVKFVNQQCVIGADGTKLLRSDVYDISFLFYVIVFLAQNLREAGYSRHFKFLKARALPVPPLAEQRRIVARVNELLSLLDELH